jgi:hypothetical protein
MEQLQNFGPNDVQNGTLNQMFRNAGINDVHSYVDEIRHENLELNEPSNRSDNLLNNVQKKSHGKNGLSNVKQIYQMVNNFQ